SDGLNGGASVIIRIVSSVGVRWHCYAIPLKPNCSSTLAEYEALPYALRMLLKPDLPVEIDSVTIYTDLAACIDRARKTGFVELHKEVAKVKLLLKKIDAHADRPGNELSDGYANHGRAQKRKNDEKTDHEANAYLKAKSNRGRQSSFTRARGSSSKIKHSVGMASKARSSVGTGRGHRLYLLR
ncbi:uncharacterized protein L969DRAFT_55165, partial [Mixia osmundae IAM 14324]